MSIEDVNKLKRRMATPTQNQVPADRGQVSGDVLSAPPVREPRSGKDVKTTPEKQAIAEQIVADAKVNDVADSREETSGTERHDLVDTFSPNIPPTIVQERLKMGQHPDTGEPWTRAEEKEWRRANEDARVQHQRAVAEQEEKMRADQSGPPPAIQPVTHVPISQLTERQKQEMQASQDAGASPVMQARVRDANHPDNLGRSMAMADQNRNPEVDPDLERAEVEGLVDENDTPEREPDPDEVEADMNKPSGQTRQ